MLTLQDIILKQINEMKKLQIIFYLALSFMISTPLFAQKIDWGIKAGLNMAKISVDPVLEAPAPSFKLGVNLGGYAELGLFDKFSLRPELSYSTQGGKDEEPGVEQTIRLDYFNVAVPIIYNLDKINLFVAPQFGYLLSGEFEEEDTADGEVDLIDHSMVYNGTDLLLGIGANYALSDQLNLDIRYNIGLTDNHNDPNEEGWYEPQQSLKSQVLQLSILYSFGK